jgi:N utilization substance protein B
MKSRHRAREVALQILYGYDMNLTTQGSPPPQGLALATALQGHFDHFKVAEDLRPFAAELVAGTLNAVAELDRLLEKHATNWKIERMSSIDRTLLRMAIHEMKSFPDIPASVTMDEAIELSKQFGTSESSAFINGILDSVHRELASL